MKYQNNITKLVYDFDFTDAKKRYKCPNCSIGSKRKNPQDLQYYAQTKTAYCHKCQSSYFEYKQFNREKEYVIPKWENKTDLTDKAVKYFNSRMISQNTLVKMKVYSAKEFIPQHNSIQDCMCFPYFADDKLINIKFRGPQKSFKLVPGAELIWYNINALKSNDEIIICEGEFDVLTWVENGFDNVISVPNGAGGNLEFLDNTIELFNDIKKIYLATDNDSPGIKLRDELIRRLGPEKCYLINFKQYKDSNDYFCGYGGIEFKNLINESIQVPVEGIVHIDSMYNEIVELYEEGVQGGKEILFQDLDKNITWETGRLAIITGIPGSGKSEFVDFLICRLNLIHGWKAAYFTPENYPLKFHYRKLHEKFSGQKFQKKTDSTDFLSIYEYVSNNFYYIMNEEDMKVDSVIKSAKALVKQKGIKILVIDPYNKLEHQYSGRKTETQYISEFLDILTNFAKFNDVLIFLVAHPTKLPKHEKPTLYSISGSANFYNKCDYGITVHRTFDENNLMTNEVEILIQKVKFKNLGSQAEVKLKYNYINGRFETTFKDVNSWDYVNWLQPELKLENYQSIEQDYEYLQNDSMPF